MYDVQDFKLNEITLHENYGLYKETEPVTLSTYVLFSIIVLQRELAKTHDST